MLTCEQCGSQDKLAVGLVFQGHHAQVCCLACGAMYDLTEQEYETYAKLCALKDPSAPSSITLENPLSKDSIEELSEDELPF